jgi:hypothetical protein
MDAPFLAGGTRGCDPPRELHRRKRLHTESLRDARGREPTQGEPGG